MVALHRLPGEKGARERGGRHTDSRWHCNPNSATMMAIPEVVSAVGLEVELQRKLQLPRRSDRA